MPDCFTQDWVSLPDEHGFCTLGPSVECTRSAIVYARAIIALVNPKLPRTFGDAVIHVSHIDYLVEGDMDLPERSPPKVIPAQKQIASLIAQELVSDGATLQLGIGAVPQAVGKELMGHKDLGIHTDMFSDEIMDLVNEGCVTNARKAVVPGQITVSFVIGTKKLFDFMNDNPFCVMSELKFVNNVKNIVLNPKVTAVNTCIEIDLTGQICADSLGSYMYSGVGGQVDFLRGAALGLDGLGKPVIAIESITKNGESKIVPLLKRGAGVVTTRAHVHYVVTEYGIAYLFGKTLLQRAHELINVAHPQHREMLERAAFERFKCVPSPA